MPTLIQAPCRTIHHTPLSQNSFAPFGMVIENPTPDLNSGRSDRGASPLVEGCAALEPYGQAAPSTSLPIASSSADPHPISPPCPTLHSPTPRMISANQNTALKYLDVSPLTSLYAQSPSQTPASTSINMFACSPRVLTQNGESLVFKIRILERHPFTTQTFIPMGLAAADSSTKYLIIVAPTLAPTKVFPDQGPPDVTSLRAFMGHGGQAVTYAAGTWHAPMVVVGARRVDFVVIQFCSGVPEEDCEEVELEGDEFGVVVDLAG